MSNTRSITFCLLAAMLAARPAPLKAQEARSVDLTFETVELPDELVRVLRDYEQA